MTENDNLDMKNGIMMILSIFIFLTPLAIATSVSVTTGGVGGSSGISTDYNLDDSASLTEGITISGSAVLAGSTVSSSGNNSITKMAASQDVIVSGNISSEGDLVSSASVFASDGSVGLGQSLYTTGLSEADVSGTAGNNQASQSSGVFDGAMASSQAAYAAGSGTNAFQSSSIGASLGYLNGEATSSNNTAKVTGGLNGAGGVSGILGVSASDGAKADGAIIAESSDSKAYAASMATSNDDDAFSYLSSDESLASVASASASGQVGASQNDINTKGNSLIYSRITDDGSIKDYSAESGDEVQGSISANSGSSEAVDAKLDGDIMSTTSELSPMPGSWVWSGLGQQLKSNPFIMRDTYGQRHIFAQGSNNGLYDNLDGDWRTLGGSIASDPIAVNDNRNIHVFAKGSDNALKDCILNIAKDSSTWKSLGGSIKTAPAAVKVPGQSNIKVTAVGDNNGIWMNNVNSNTVTGSWSSLGGSIAAGSSPSMAVDAQGNTHTYVRYSDNSLRDNINGVWKNLGGQITSDPRPVVNPSAGTVTTYARGSDGKLVSNVLSSAGTTQWQTLGGSIGGATTGSIYKGTPAPVVDSSGKTHVFVRGSDSALWEYANGAWTSRGGKLTSDPSASNCDGLLEVAARSSDGTLSLAQPEVYGANPNPTGNPIGGGSGYKKTVSRSEAKVVVNSAASLKNALATAQSGDIIYVDDNAQIDLTSYGTLTIPTGVTLASGRGTGGSKGALIYTKKLYSTPNTVKEDPIMFATGGQGVRVTGIRLQGPDPNVGTNPYGTSIGVGINVKYAKTEVDNCELWGWSHAAVKLDGRYQPAFANVHHNYIHNNQKTGWGYGVSLKEGTVQASIKGNLFDYNRHSVTGWGVPQTRYEAAYNIQGPHAVSSIFDMHGGKDRADGTNIAGDWMKVHHNTVQYTGTASSVVVRGIPVTGAWINNNWFYKSYQPSGATQLNAYGRFYVSNNLFGQ